MLSPQILFLSEPSTDETSLVSLRGAAECLGIGYQALLTPDCQGIIVTVGDQPPVGDSPATTASSLKLALAENVLLVIAAGASHRVRAEKCWEDADADVLLLLDKPGATVLLEDNAIARLRPELAGRVDEDELVLETETQVQQLLSDLFIRTP